MMVLACVVVALLFAGTATAEAPASGWYRGLIGRTATALDTPERYARNKEVELELRVDAAGRVSGSYFYFDAGTRERGADIAIQGRMTPEGLVRLEEQVGSRVTGRWQGSLVAFELKGTWTDPSGRRKIPFVLWRLEDKDGEERQVTPQMAYRGRRVVGTNLQAPFLTRHPRPEAMKRVNDQIQAWFHGGRCDPTLSFPGWPDDYYLNWEVAYASEDLWSVEVSEGWFCGDQPMDEHLSFTFDLTTGKPVDFTELFQDYEGNRDAILQTLFADASANLDADCKAAVASIAWKRGPDAPSAPGIVFLGDSFDYHLTPTALHAYEIRLPPAMSSCALRAEVPYEKLRRFMAPGSPIALILEAGKPNAAR